MSWFTYIIYSSLIDKYYTGNTENIKVRLDRHNSGWGRYTKIGIPWILVYSEELESKSLAIKRENEIKKKKSRKYIERLISHAGSRPEPTYCRQVKFGKSRRSRLRSAPQNVGGQARQYIEGSYLL